MQDTKLFETILGITAPWHVVRVELKAEDKRVDLWLAHEATRWPCPEPSACCVGESRSLNLMHGLYGLPSPFGYELATLLHPSGLD